MLQDLWVALISVSSLIASKFLFVSGLLTALPISNLNQELPRQFTNCLTLLLVRVGRSLKGILLLPHWQEVELLAEG